MSTALLFVFVALVALTNNACRKSNGNTQKGVDESVKAVVWGVLALVALAYLTGWA